MRLMFFSRVREIDLSGETDLDRAGRSAMIVEPEAEFASRLGTTNLDVLGFFLFIESHFILLTGEMF